MNQEQFQELLKKYQHNTCSPEEQNFIDEWYSAIENKSMQPLNSLEEGELKKRHWLNVNEHIQQTKTKKQRVQEYILFSWQSISIAASITLFIGIFFYLQPKTASTQDFTVSIPSKKTEMKLITNDGTETSSVQLPDGTKISLRPGSQISFIESFNKIEREIFLEGEAFFEVARDISRPFLVYTNEVTTKVLGTSFTIRALPEDKHITVAVKTGKVSVYTHQDETKVQPKPSETILTPNQQIIYNRRENKVFRTLVNTPQALMPAEEIKRMRFEEAPVAEIFTALETIYAVDIVFDEKLLSGCTLTTSISDGTIYNRLDIICNAIGATYSIEETQIVISGLGCN